MKLLSFTILFAMTSVMVAENAPQVIPSDRYVELYKNSPFTDPVVKDPPPIEKELQDWALIGVRKYRAEQFVTVVNLKDRSQRIEIPGADAEVLGFSLEEVEVARSFLNTRVKIRKGKESDWLEYDPKVLSAKKSPAKTISKKVAPNNQLPPTPGKRVRYVPRPK